MNRAVVVLLALMMAGCAASVRYAPRVPGVIPGYVEQRLGEDTYQVRIGEAWPKDWPDLEKFAIFRAAELTQDRGLRYFAVLEASSRVNSYVIPVPETSTTTGTANVVGSTAYISTRTTTSGGGSSSIQGGWYTLEFRMLPETEVDRYQQVVDSKQVIKDLRYFIDSRRPSR